MLYFTTVSLPENISKEQIENTLRKYALKQGSSLDFNFTSVNIGTEKMFLGLEGKNDLKFTRVKTSFEQFLPKFIISLPNDPGARFYRIRLSAVPVAILGLLGFSLITGLFALIQGRTTVADLVPFVVILLVYLLLLRFEFGLTTSRLKKAIEKVEELR